jgi:hypothetical protein
MNGWPTLGCSQLKVHSNLTWGSACGGWCTQTEARAPVAAEQQILVRTPAFAFLCSTSYLPIAC